MGTENVTATVPLSNGTHTLQASRHSRPEWPERRERTVAGGRVPDEQVGPLQSCSAASVGGGAGLVS